MQSVLCIASDGIISFCIIGCANYKPICQQGRFPHTSAEEVEEGDERERGEGVWEGRGRRVMRGEG